MEADARLAHLTSWMQERDWAVDASRLPALLAYLDAMLIENQQINLTGIRDPRQALILHALDSLAPAGLDLQPATCLDLGTGNGFPGLAMRCLYPLLELTLLDRTQKKLLAIQRALAAAELPAVETLHLDARQAAESAAFDRRFDLITVRAMATPAEIAPLAVSLLSRDGILLLWLAGNVTAPKRLGNKLRLHSELPYQLPEPASRRHQLAVYGKAAGLAAARRAQRKESSPRCPPRSPRS